MSDTSPKDQSAFLEKTAAAYDRELGDQGVISLAQKNPEAFKEASPPAPITVAKIKAFRDAAAASGASPETMAVIQEGAVDLIKSAPKLH